MNVFEASDYGADIPTFTFADDGTPLLDAATEYGLWSTGLGVDAGDFSTSSAFGYPEEELAFAEGSRLDMQPRSSDLYLPQYKNTLDLASRPDESFDPTALASTNGDGVLAPNAAGLTNLAGSSSAGLVESAPSVLQAGPTANQLQQRQLQQGQRLSLEADDMYESQAGPSRGLQRSRDALSASNSPYGRVRPSLQGARSFHNLGAAAGSLRPNSTPNFAVSRLERSRPFARTKP